MSDLNFDPNSGRNNQELGEQIKNSVNASADWIDKVINDIHAGINTQKQNSYNETYQANLRERARIQQERQRQLQERTKRRQEMARRFGHVSADANVFRYIAAFFLLMFCSIFIRNGFNELFKSFAIPSMMFDFCAGLACGYGAFTSVGKSIKMNRYIKYVNVIGEQTYVPIADFERILGYSHDRVIKDIRAMIASGILKQGHIDDKQQYLMVTNEVYNQYLDSKTEYDAKAAVDEMRKKEEQQEKARENGEMDPDVKKALEQGVLYIQRIREANDRIEGEEISKKLDRLESISVQIFKAVELHPEKLPEIRKFMDYYMPTTLKLVNSYYEFDMQSVQGENIVNAKKEIENTLDMINMAFENLSDRLYESDTMDVSADISVLKTLLAQEGLKGEDFKL